MNYDFDRTNPILSTDFYTACSNTFASPEAKEYSCYNFTNRYSPQKGFEKWNFVEDSRMIMYGLSYFYKKELERQVTHEHVDEAVNFMSRSHSFGGAIPFDEKMWRDVVRLNNGYLPIRINSIPEGGVFFPNEPIIHVENTLPGFGELAAHVEARLVGAVSKTSCIATMMFHWRERIKEEIAKDLEMVYGKADSKKVDEIAQWSIHNFGSRACDNADVSILSGMAHLLAFNGTDNTDAALEVWRQGAEQPCGSSILALAHRNVQAYGSDINTVRAVASVPGAKIVSCVADCYNFAEATKQIVQEAKNNPDIIYVIRPDSGDGYTCIRFIIETAITAGVCKYENGYPIATNLRFIYGDSVNPISQREIHTKLRADGYPANLWGIFGVGGWIINNATRDTLSSAYKLCLIGKNQPVVKLSETPSKMSVPFKNDIYRNFLSLNVSVAPSSYLGYNYKFYQPGSGIDTSYLFPNVRSFANQEWKDSSQFAKENPNFGCGREHLHQTIRDFQDAEYAKHRGVKIFLDRQ